MKKSRIWLWVGGGLFLLMFASIAWIYVTSALRPNRLSFKIREVYPQPAKVADAFNVSLMTRDFVVSEGPCPGFGCSGGILSEQYPIDLKDLIPNLKGYNEESTTIIWLYQVKPTEVTRNNDWTGSDTVTISGVLTNEQKIYYAVIPKHIVEPRLEWVYVQTK